MKLNFTLYIVYTTANNVYATGFIQYPLGSYCSSERPRCWILALQAFLERLCFSITCPHGRGKQATSCKFLRGSGFGHGDRIRLLEPHIGVPGSQVRCPSEFYQVIIGLRLFYKCCRFYIRLRSLVDLLSKGHFHIVWVSKVGLTAFIFLKVCNTLGKSIRNANRF